MADFAGRTVAVDSRTGTTVEDLWGPEARPSSLRPVQGVDDWLTLISTGKAMGMSSEATVTQYPRPGVAYRPVRDAPIWCSLHSGRTTRQVSLPTSRAWPGTCLLMPGSDTV